MVKIRPLAITDQRRRGQTPAIEVLLYNAALGFMGCPYRADDMQQQWRTPAWAMRSAAGGLSASRGAPGVLRFDLTQVRNRDAPSGKCATISSVPPMASMQRRRLLTYRSRSGVPAWRWRADWTWRRCGEFRLRLAPWRAFRSSCRAMSCLSSLHLCPQSGPGVREKNLGRVHETDDGRSCQVSFPSEFFEILS